MRFVSTLFFLFFLLIERLVRFPLVTRNLTGIVSVKKASIKKKPSVELSEDQAAVMIQKGRTNG